MISKHQHGRDPQRLTPKGVEAVPVDWLRIRQRCDFFCIPGDFQMSYFICHIHVHLIRVPVTLYPSKVRNSLSKMMNVGRTELHRFTPLHSTQFHSSDRLPRPHFRMLSSCQVQCSAHMTTMRMPLGLRLGAIRAHGHVPRPHVGKK